MLLLRCYCGIQGRAEVERQTPCAPPNNIVSMQRDLIVIYMNRLERVTLLDGANLAEPTRCMLNAVSVGGKLGLLTHLHSVHPDLALFVSHSSSRSVMN